MEYSNRTELHHSNYGEKLDMVCGATEITIITMMMMEVGGNGLMVVLLGNVDFVHKISKDFVLIYNRFFVNDVLQHFQKKSLKIFQKIFLFFTYHFSNICFNLSVWKIEKKKLKFKIKYQNSWPLSDPLTSLPFMHQPFNQLSSASQHNTKGLFYLKKKK